MSSTSSKPPTTPHLTQPPQPHQLQILSPLFQPKTTATPIPLLIPNTHQPTKHYRNIPTSFPPGHAHYT
ncbi:chorismate synthase, partial [Neisseria sicca]|uniref:chorismate synthase n=1 Tax=Neisseria sicca TaxID=490 RepID=UPI0011BD0A44